MNRQPNMFQDLDALAAHLREWLQDSNYLLLFAYNGTGKTRLSMAFKETGKAVGGADTLYFNAFTEDLFSWDNDLDSDTHRVLKLNANSRFFAGLSALEMDTRIRPLLRRYADFDFKIDTDTWTVAFEREISRAGAVKTVENIKISRGEENTFIWCFFLAIVQLAVDRQEAYQWVKYLYIDDPISSLDDNNTIAVAAHLAQMLKNQNTIKAVISSHHTLFFNVMWHELKAKSKQCRPYFLDVDTATGGYSLRHTRDTPFFHHVALLKQLHDAAESGQLYTYHFNILRGILEKTAAFHGFKHFSACIKRDQDDLDGIVHKRMINILSHGNYSLFEPMEMVAENKRHFSKMLKNFMRQYRFNPELFAEEGPAS